jgi:hypothetical protein
MRLDIRDEQVESSSKSKKSCKTRFATILAVLSLTISGFVITPAGEAFADDIDDRKEADKLRAVEAFSNYWNGKTVIFGCSSSCDDLFNQFAHDLLGATATVLGTGQTLLNNAEKQLASFVKNFSANSTAKIGDIAVYSDGSSGVVTSVGNGGKILFSVKGKTQVRVSTTITGKLLGYLRPVAGKIKSAPLSYSSNCSNGSCLSLYRFYNSKTGVHYYATSSAAPAGFYLEGNLGYVLPTQNKPTALQVPVWGFKQPSNSGRLYTINLQERDNVRNNFSAYYKYEGESFTAWKSSGTGLIPIYRIYDNNSNTHFFTSSAQERDTVVSTWPSVYRYEGIAFYVSAANK